MARNHTNITKRPSGAKLMTIQPIVAAKWLEKNKHNRRIVRAHLERLKLILQKGDYEVTGDTIKFDRDGNLLDGQHRLMACMQTDIPIQSWVVFGLDPNVFAKIDQGAIRTTAHVLSIEDDMGRTFKDSRTVAAAITSIHGIEAAIQSGTMPKTAGWTLKERLEANYAREYALENKDLLVEAVGVVRGTNARTVVRPAGTFVGLYVILARKNHSRTREFFEALASGTGLTATDPVYRLRELLISSIGDRTRTAPWKAAVTLKAWNAWLKKRPMRQLRFGENESFPTPRTRG